MTDMAALDENYQKMVENLQKVRDALGNVATARKRLEIQAGQLQGQAQKLQDHADQALRQGQRDLANEALARRATLLTQLETLRAQRQLVETQQQQIESTATRLAMQVDSFRIRMERLQTQRGIVKAATGAASQSGPSAIDELIASGATAPAGRVEMPNTQSAPRESSTGQSPSPVGEETNPLLVADELAKLAELRDRGILSGDEFLARKAKLLGA